VLVFVELVLAGPVLLPVVARAVGIVGGVAAGLAHDGISSAGIGSSTSA
jgi:hypothetical protein